MEILTEEEIIKKAKKFQLHSIVYFLIHKNKIVYVGQSKNFNQRILDHFKEGNKIFDSYHFIEVPKRKLDEIERFYITKFKPKYNKTFITTGLITVEKLKNIIKENNFSLELLEIYLKKMKLKTINDVQHIPEHKAQDLFDKLKKIYWDRFEDIVFHYTDLANVECDEDLAGTEFQEKFLFELSMINNEQFYQKERYLYRGYSEHRKTLNKMKDKK